MKKQKIIGVTLLIIIVGLVFVPKIITKTHELKPSSNKSYYNIGSENISEWPDKETLNTLETIKLRLSDNFFPSPNNDGTYWLSVSKGPYNGQFYSRDTFVTARGGIYMGDPYISHFKDAVAWFSKNMKEDGYIPIWFRKTDDLNVYEFCPYDRNEETGGIRQVDHILEYVDAMWLSYSWSGDETFLKIQLPYARKAWNYLKSKTSNYLINEPISQYSGLDWADKVLRGGTSSFIQAYWYHSTISLAYMEKSSGNTKAYEELINYADKIKENINQYLWTNSKPKNSNESFGHFVAWKDTGRDRDYFEIDSNMFMVAEKIPDQGKTDSIMDFFLKNYAKFDNGTGATRVLLGTYDKQDMFDTFKDGQYQNGGYWYIVSYPLSKALSQGKHSKELLGNLNDTLNTFRSSETGLLEWYYPDGKTGGAPNYSWSLAYPFYMVYNAILGIETTPEGLTIAPTLPDNIVKIAFNLRYRDKDLQIKIDLNKSKELFISNAEMQKDNSPSISISN